MTKITSTTEMLRHVNIWWELHGWAKPSPDHIPPVGYMAYGDDDKPISACWIYETPCSFALIEWIVADPLCDKLNRRKALDEMLNFAKEHAKSKGIKSLFMTTSNKALIKRLIGHGFTETDHNCTNLVCRLGE